MPNETNEKSKVVIEILVGVIVLIVIAFVFVLPKTLNENKSDKKDNNKNTVDTAPNKFSDCNKSKCVYTFTVDGKENKLTFESSDNNDILAPTTLTFNNKKINKNDGDGKQPESYYVLDDVLVVRYHEGTDVSGTSIQIYDMDGKVIKTYEKSVGNYFIMAFISDYNVDTKNKTIDITGSRIMNGTIYDEKGATNYIVNSPKTDLAKINVNDDTVVSGMYEIKYEGDYKFSEPTIKYTQTLKDVIGG